MLEDFSEQDWKRRSGFTVVTPTVICVWDAMPMAWRHFDRRTKKCLGMEAPDHRGYSAAGTENAVRLAMKAMDAGERFTVEDLRRWRGPREIK